MEISTGDITVRQALLGVFLAAMIVSSGCAGLLSDENDSNGLDTPTATSGQENSTSRPGGVDLRNVSIPDSGNVTVSGELDHEDPKSGNKYYEPVQISAVEGQLVNITVEAENGNPALRVIDPDGNVSATYSNESGNSIGSYGAKFVETGRFTFEVTSANRNATFNYTLTVEGLPDDFFESAESDELFAGPMSEWNETERYLEFGQDFVYAANITADNGQFYSHVGKGGIQANAEEDYLIISYQWNAENLNLTQMVDVDVAKQLTYKNLLNEYQDAGKNESAENESWVPEVIYFRAENPQGELYRTVFMTKAWAQDYLDTQNGRQLDSRYYSTNRIGPGSPSYDPTGSDSVYTTDEEFPLGTYRNYTHDDGQTHAEKYYNATTDDS